MQRAFALFASFVAGKVHVKKQIEAWILAETLLGFGLLPVVMIMGNTTLLGLAKKNETH